MKFLTDLINGLHYSLGISTPRPEQVRMVVLLWLVSILVIIGAMYLLVRYEF